MDTRFNSFYTEDLHPFAKATYGLLDEVQLRASRPSWWNSLMWTSNKRFDENLHIVREFASGIIARRSTVGSRKKDLVHAMLKTKDPNTGQQLESSAIVDNMITFLIAGMPKLASQYNAIHTLVIQHLLTDSFVTRARKHIGATVLSICIAHNASRSLHAVASRG